jgi:predicted N-acetyltransferase YhbS
MQILSLIEVSHHADTIAQWIWDEWRGGEARQTFEETRAVLLRHPGTPPTIVALDANAPIGVLGFSRFMLGEREPLLLFINSLFVVEAHRGRGIGTALLRDALGRVGPEDTFVYVYTGLRAWYQARGFVVIQENGETGNAVLRTSRRGSAA